MTEKQSKDSHAPGSEGGGSGKHVESAGAFDIRTFIAALIGLFGLIVLLTGLFGFSPEEAAKTGGVNANLWAGIAMIVFAALFAVWSKVDPIRFVVQDNAEGAEEERDFAALD